MLINPPYPMEKHKTAGEIARHIFNNGAVNSYKPDEFECWIEQYAKEQQRELLERLIEDLKNDIALNERLRQGAKMREDNHDYQFHLAAKSILQDKVEMLKGELYKLQ
jgi:DNA-binding transcriptional regulator YbjK